MQTISNGNRLLLFNVNIFQLSALNFTYMISLEKGVNLLLPLSFLHLNDTAWQKDSGKLDSDMGLTGLWLRLLNFAYSRLEKRRYKIIKNKKTPTQSFFSGGINNVTIYCF